MLQSAKLSPRFLAMICLIFIINPVFCPHFSWAATAVFGAPVAHARTIRALTLSRWPKSGDFVICCSSRRSIFVKLSFLRGLPCDIFSSNNVICDTEKTLSLFYLFVNIIMTHDTSVVSQKFFSYIINRCRHFLQLVGPIEGGLFRSPQHKFF